MLEKLGKSSGGKEKKRQEINEKLRAQIKKNNEKRAWRMKKTTVNKIGLKKIKII